VSNELTVYQKINDPIAAAKEMGIAIARSGLLGLPNEEAGMVVALTCLCEGLTPLDYQRRYHTIQGRPAMRADAMLAEFRMNHGGRHRKIEKTENRAAVELTLDGNADEFELTWQEAQDAGWPWRDKEDHSQGLKDNWNSKRGRQTMLWARVISDAVRTVCPEVNAGVYTPEEVEDFDDRNGAPIPRRKTNEAVVSSEEVRPAEPEAEAAPTMADLVATEPLATTAQILEIEGLAKHIKLSEESLKKAIEKRGLQTIDQLSKRQADEMLDKLRAKVMELQGN